MEALDGSARRFQGLGGAPGWCSGGSKQSRRGGAAVHEAGARAELEAMAAATGAPTAARTKQGSPEVAGDPGGAGACGSARGSPIHGGGVLEDSCRERREGVEMRGPEEGENGKPGRHSTEAARVEMLGARLEQRRKRRGRRPWSCCCCSRDGEGDGKRARGPCSFGRWMAEEDLLPWIVRARQSAPTQ